MEGEGPELALYETHADEYRVRCVTDNEADRTARKVAYAVSKVIPETRIA